MKHVWAMTWMLVAAAAPGCVNAFAVTQIPKETFGTSQPVALFSVGATQPCKAHAIYLVLLQDQPRQWPYDRPQEVDILPVAVDTDLTKDDFAEFHGRLNAVALNPGRYFLATRSYEGASKEIPTLWFDLKPGETAYLGEIFATVSCGLSGQLEIRDAYQRDVALTIKKNPGFANRPIIKRLMKFGETIHVKQSRADLTTTEQLAARAAR